MMKKISYWISIGLVVSLIMVGLFSFSPMNKNETFNNPSLLQTFSSTNPSSPVILTADTEVVDPFTSSDTSYYYKTAVITSNYGVVWIYPFTADNYDLHIYTDSGYSTLLDSSAVGGVGEIEWVVIKKGAETDYYPRVWVPIANEGTGIIEYDSALVCGRGQAKGNDHLDTTDAIEGYYIYLDSTKTYDLSLTVPVTGDFNLYLYYLESSITADPTEYISNSNATGLGTDEAITSYAPPQSDTYVVLIVWASGDGTFSFIYDYAESIGGGIPGFAVFGALLGLAIVFVYRRRSLQFPKNII